MKWNCVPIGRRSLVVALVITFVAGAMAITGLWSGGISASAASSCTSSVQGGACFFAKDTTNFPGINPGPGRPDSNAIEVDQNVWNSGSSACAGWSQTLTANSDQNWSVSANYPAGNTAVCAYTNEWPHDEQGTVDSYSQTLETFHESMPHNASTVAWAMNDNWFNNWANEVMIQYDFSSNGNCDSVATDVVFNGQPWHLCVFGTQESNGSYPTTDWKLGADESSKQSESAGTIDVLAMTQWLENHDSASGQPYLPTASTWTALSQGWEIASTGGTNETFTDSGFSVHMVPKGGTTTTTTSASPSPPSHGSPAPNQGYWLVGSDGGIFSFGSARFEGSTGSLRLQRPVVGITRTPGNSGYWLAASDGGVFAFNAPFVGSIPGLGLHPAGSGIPHSLNQPIVGMVPSANGQGYYMVAGDGGVFAFNSTFAGSCPGIGGCAGAAVAVAPDASGNGYWLTTAAGHIYSFGDARYFGAPGPQSSPITSMVRTPDGGGYYILDANGQVFAYGDAMYLGGVPGGAAGGLNPATAIFDTGDGYWISTALGRVFPLGDAPADGDMSGTHLNGSIIAATGF